jgi:hypothetical protein
MSDKVDPEAQKAAGYLFGAVFVLLLLPGFAAGLAGGEFLRRKRLSWTWGLCASALFVPVGALLIPSATDALGAAINHIIKGNAGATVLAAPLAPFWLTIWAPVMTAWKIWRDRRAAISGGEAEQRAKDQLGPVQLLRLRRHAQRALAAGPFSPEEGVLLGTGARGRPTHVPPLEAHALIVGGSSTGKTNTAKVLLEGHVAAGHSFLVLDGKGGPALAHTAVELGRRYDRPVALWSLLSYGDSELDGLRLPWNVTGEGNPTEIKDRIASTEEQSEPFFRAVASRGLLMASRALTTAYGGVDLDRLAQCMENPDRLAAILKSNASAANELDLQYLKNLTDTERSGFRGMGLRLRTMCQSDGSEWLLPASNGEEISLYRAIRDGWLVVFSLPQGLYPELIPHVARYIMSTLNGVCTRLETEGLTAKCLVFVDELSAFDGEQFSNSYERARSAGVSIAVATQSLSNLETAGGPKLLHGALDNSELFLVHRQAVPEAAELLAAIAGTVEAWEHTQQVQDGRGFGGGTTGIELGLDESGQRARRKTDQFVIHPNKIKRLGTGQVALIVTPKNAPAPDEVPEKRAEITQIRLGLSSHDPSARAA